jgi:succinoglycan biosynthesis transport protein ExoP
VLAQVRDAADYVIVDSPPLLPVADTRVLLQLSQVDGVIMIGRAGVSRRDRLRAASRVLSQSGSRVFGLVVTDVKLAAGSGYYQYGYEEPDQRNGRPRSRQSRASRVRSPS